MERNEVKHGQVYINRGFEAAYKTKFYHSIVRVLKVDGNVVTVRSLSDNMFGRFSCGDWPNTPFQLDLEKDFLSGRFRPYKSGDLQKLLKHRYVNKVLYGK